MKQLERYWAQVTEWVDGRRLMERIGIFVGLAAVASMFAYILFLVPAFNEEKRIAREMVNNLGAIQRLQAEMAKARASSSGDPDQQNKLKLKQLQQQIDEAEAQISRVRKELVSPQQMVTMLDTILARHDAVKLISFTKLPLESLNTGTIAAVQGAPAQAAGKSDPQPGAGSGAGSGAGNAAVYRHGVQVVVEGKYLDLMKYLAELEKLPGKLVWGHLELKVDEYPKATLTLDLFTLSLDKTWLNI